jgi:Tol biopolymer transport system component
VVATWTGLDVDVSPSGAALLNTRISDAGTVAWIDRIDLPGGQQTMITPMFDDSGSPTWAPSGQRIAYTRLPPASQEQLVTANPDGTDIRLVIRNAGSPSWQPK